MACCVTKTTLMTIVKIRPMETVMKFLQWFAFIRVDKRAFAIFYSTVSGDLGEHFGDSAQIPLLVLLQPFDQTSRICGQIDA